MSGIHIAIPWPRGPPYERGALRGPLRGPRPAAAGLLGAGAPRLRGCGPAPGELLRQGAGPGQGGVRALAWARFPSAPIPAPPPVVPPGFSGMRAGRGGAARCSPRPFSRAGFGPSSQAAPLGLGRPRAAARPSPGCGRPPARPAGRPCPGRAAPWPGLRGDRLAVWAPPCGALRAAPARPWPSPGGACARLRRRRVPLAFALRAGAAPRPGSSRPGAVRPGGRFCPPPPGVGVGVTPPAGGGVAFQFLGI